MGYQPHDNKKLKWHKVFAYHPRIIGGKIVWMEHFYRKGKLVNSRGDHALQTTIEYAWRHTEEEHFVWLLTGEEDEIVDETFWAKYAVHWPNGKPPPPPPPPPRKVP